MEIDLLTDVEMDRLDDFLLDRNRDDELEYDESLDEGIFCISELDGFFTAIVSGPAPIQPSVWLPKVWGDFDPVWNSDDEFMEIFSLMTRHMNGIVANLMSSVMFQPLFMESQFEGKKKHLIVDEWCEGYMRGVTITEDDWDIDSPKMIILLTPIRIFTMENGLLRLDKMSNAEIENIQNAIVPNVNEIHAYWLEKREQDRPETAQTYRKDAPSIGRNDLCPCGSGKKFKKCCLH